MSGHPKSLFWGSTKKGVEGPADLSGQEREVADLQSSVQALSNESDQLRRVLFGVEVGHGYPTKEYPPTGASNLRGKKGNHHDFTPMTNSSGV